jgi:hypothetical protein
LSDNRNITFQCAVHATKEVFLKNNPMLDHKQFKALWKLVETSPSIWDLIIKVLRGDYEINGQKALRLTSEGFNQILGVDDAELLDLIPKLVLGTMTIKTFNEKCLWWKVEQIVRSKILNFLRAFPDHQDTKCLDDLSEQFPTLCGDKFIKEWTHSVQDDVVSRDDMTPLFITSLKEQKAKDEADRHPANRVTSLFVVLVVFFYHHIVRSSTTTVTTLITLTTYISQSCTFAHTQTMILCRSRLRPAMSIWGSGCVATKSSSTMSTPWRWPRFTMSCHSITVSFCCLCFFFML